VPFTPWLPIAGALSCVYLMIALPLATWVRLFLWLAVGMAIYLLYGRRNARRVRDGAANG
jgi:APA family basic amino acid/polyamine antiporter